MSAISGQIPTPQHVHIENPDASFEALKKDGVTSSKSVVTRLTAEQLTQSFQTNQQDGAAAQISITNYHPSMSSEVEVDIGKLRALLDSTAFASTQETELHLLKMVMVMIQSSIPFQSAFGPVAMLAENEEQKNKLLQLLALLDKIAYGGQDGDLINLLLTGEVDHGLEEKLEQEALEHDSKAGPNENVKIFHMNIMDSGTKLALMLTATFLEFRQAKLEYTSSVIHSRDLVNQSYRAGIIQRGRDAMVTGMSGHLLNGLMSAAGGAASLKSHTKTSAAMDDYGKMAPQQKARVESLKSDIHEIEAQPAPDAGKLKAMRETLADEQSKLDTMDTQYNTAQHQAMRNNMNGQMLQQMSGSLGGAITSSGEMVNAVNDAANAHSQATEEQLRELMDGVRDSQQQDVQRLNSMLDLMRSLIETQRALYSNI